MPYLDRGQPLFLRMRPNIEFRAHRAILIQIFRFLFVLASKNIQNVSVYSEYFILPWDRLYSTSKAVCSPYCYRTLKGFASLMGSKKESHPRGHRHFPLFLFLAQVRFYPGSPVVLFLVQVHLFRKEHYCSFPSQPMVIWPLFRGPETSITLSLYHYYHMTMPPYSLNNKPSIIALITYIFPKPDFSKTGCKLTLDLSAYDIFSRC